MSSGFPESDAQSDFTRARRSRLLADIGRRLRREPDDVALMLPFEEVVESLGRTGQHDLGLQEVPVDAIVGTVDRGVDFDRGLRPTSARLRSRWERIAAAQRRGEALPPVSLYKIGDLYFIRDGHHRVSVAKSLGRTDIDAYVVEVTTRLRLGEETLVSDLPLKDHERLFRERVRLPAVGDRGRRDAHGGALGLAGGAPGLAGGALRLAAALGALVGIQEVRGGRARGRAEDEGDEAAHVTGLPLAGTRKRHHGGLRRICRGGVRRRRRRRRSSRRSRSITSSLHSCVRSTR